MGANRAPPKMGNVLHQMRAERAVANRANPARANPLTVRGKASAPRMGVPIVRKNARNPKMPARMSPRPALTAAPGRVLVVVTNSAMAGARPPRTRPVAAAPRDAAEKAAVGLTGASKSVSTIKSAGTPTTATARGARGTATACLRIDNPPSRVPTAKPYPAESASAIPKRRRPSPRASLSSMSPWPKRLAANVGVVRVGAGTDSRSISGSLIWCFGSPSAPFSSDPVGAGKAGGVVSVRRGG